VQIKTQLIQAGDHGHPPCRANAHQSLATTWPAAFDAVRAPANWRPIYPPRQRTLLSTRVPTAAPARSLIPAPRRSAPELRRRTRLADVLPPRWSSSWPGLSTNAALEDPLSYHMWIPSTQWASNALPVLAGHSWRPPGRSDASPRPRVVPSRSEHLKTSTRPFISRAYKRDHLLVLALTGMTSSCHHCCRTMARTSPAPPGRPLSKLAPPLDLS